MRTLQKDTRRIMISRALFVLIAAVVTVLDQITKRIAVEKLKPIETYPLWKDVFHLTYCTNKGAAFSMLSGHRWVFIVITSVALVAMTAAIFVLKKNRYPFYIFMGMVVGGGIGNMIDRLGAGYVVDFFDFRLINFAIFNVADVFVCVGTALLAIDVIFIEDPSSFSLRRSKKDLEKDDKDDIG